MSQSTCCEIEGFAKALGQETRQQILRLLMIEEMNVGELTQHLGLTQPTISHHLAILRRTKLVVSRRQGKQIFYEANQDCVIECCQDILDKFNASTEYSSLG